MEYFSKHFAVISVVSTLWSAGLVLAFFVGYLSVFDSSLIWLVEYQDLLKFGVVTFSIVAASIAILANVYHGITQWSDNKPLRYFIISCSVMFALVLGYRALFTQNNGNGWLIAISVGLLFVFIKILAEVPEAIKEPSINPHWVVQKLILVPVFICWIWGQSYGKIVKESPKFLDIETGVSSKMPDDLRGLQLVLFLSHHAIFRTNDKIIVIPSGDITRLSMSAVNKVDAPLTRGP